MKHNTSIPSSHWIFVYHVKKKNHLQNEAKVPLSIRPRALVPNASNLHSNIVWKTHFSKLLSLEFTFVNSNYTKKKKKKKKSTWKIENGGEAGTNWMLHFYTDDVAFKSFSKEGAIYDWCTCVKLCSWLEVYAERPLSLSLILQTAASHVQKNGRPCFLRLLEFLSHRCYSRSTNLPDSWRLPCLDERLTPP